MRKAEVAGGVTGGVNGGVKPGVKSGVTGALTAGDASGAKSGVAGGVTDGERSGVESGIVAGDAGVVAAGVTAASSRGTRAKRQAQVVNTLLKKVERRFSKDAVKATLGDYFANNGAGVPYSGMPFYDAWNQGAFTAAYGRAMTVFTTNTANPALYPDESAYLPAVIGNFTSAIMSFVRTTQPTCRFEVLYPIDVNQTTFNQTINYPQTAWTPSALDCLKTEAIGFTLGRDLVQSEGAIDFGQSLGFTAAQRSHLVSIGDSTTVWLKEAQIAQGKRFESVVLFALDQFCLIGYDVPLPESPRRSVRMGS